MIEVIRALGEMIEELDIPGIGKFVMIEDSEGNHVGMLQPQM